MSEIQWQMQVFKCKVEAKTKDSANVNIIACCLLYNYVYLNNGFCGSTVKDEKAQDDEDASYV